MHLFRRAALALLSAFLAGPALADPGAGIWTLSNGVYSYTYTGDVNSVAKRLPEGLWTVCFDPSAAADGAAAAQVQLRRQVGATAVDNSSTIVSADAVSTLTGATGSACFFNVPAGTYWIDSTVSPAGATAVVTIERVFAED